MVRYNGYKMEVQLTKSELHPLSKKTPSGGKTIATRIYGHKQDKQDVASFPIPLDITLQISEAVKAIGRYSRGGMKLGGGRRQECGHRKVLNPL